METLQFHFEGGRTRGRQQSQLVGVVSSGNLEVLYNTNPTSIGPLRALRRKSRASPQTHCN